ncbi:hypothetical protein T07_4771 [Trichinella nelsoni]|uniref:Uncharacterized protein n=1 Tax=Trichinella nelsoni TaxID=6336 RepID=A0A0V0RA80_9BILA|nr:hypothetical protein T07_4771 [Trichinella nelsoni]
MTGESVVFHPSGQPRVLQSWNDVNNQLSFVDSRLMFKKDIPV